MKKYSLPLLCLAACLLLSGCNMTLMGENNNTIPYETFDTRPQSEDPGKMILYKKAMKALAYMQYQEALDLFTELGDFEDAAEYAARFTYIEDTLLRTEQYTDGVLTQTNEAAYDQEGNLLGSSQDSGIRMGSEVSENGNLRAETWQYLDYIVTTHYDAYTHVGAVTKEEKRPIFHNPNVDGVKEGHNINYVYNANGLLVKDNGEVQQHTQNDGKVSIKKMLFNGTYTYDTEGRLQRYDREYTWGGMGTGWTIYEYDDQDRVIREKSGKEGDFFFIDTIQSENAYRQENTTKEYRYDEVGNLVFMSQLTTSYAMNKPPETYYIQQEYVYVDGRLVQETTTFGDASDTIIETVYVYGDYLGYIIEEGS